MRLNHVSEAGFTLVEILMVVFILGLSAGVVVLALPEQADVLEAEADRLEQTVDILSKRAVLTETIHSLEFTTDSYGAAYWQDGIWVVIPRWQRELPTELSLNVRRPDAREAPERIVFHPTGVPFEAEIVLTGRRGARVELSTSPSRLKAAR